MMLGQTIGLLFLSNVFMTIAWYGHLRFGGTALWKVILISWLIAFFEYCLQVPANRIGHHILSAAQLKTLQEAITFVVFAVFSWWYLKERLTAYDLAAFGLVFAAVGVSLFQPRA